MFKKLITAFGIKHATDDSQLFDDIMTSDDYEFINFVSKHGKSYGTRAEFNFRKQQFQKALDKVADHNSQNGATYTLGINEFADWTEQEWKRVLGYRPEMKVQTNEEPLLLSEDNLADSVDWNTKGAVTPVKN